MRIQRLLQHNRSPLAQVSHALPHLTIVMPGFHFSFVPLATILTLGAVGMYITYYPIEGDKPISIDVTAKFENPERLIQERKRLELLAWKQAQEALQEP